MSPKKAAIGDPFPNRRPTRYCGMCDCLVHRVECERCGFDTDPAPKPRKLTRQEHLEGLADRGIDTFADYRGER